MKIALLAYAHQMYWFLSGLEKGLKRNGHQVKGFYQVGPKSSRDHELINWLNFDLKKLEAFNPERIYIFNGYAKESYAATNYLKSKYNVYFVERGWLPQARNIYIDRVGLGGRSSLATRNLSRFKDPLNARFVDNTIRYDHYCIAKFKPPELQDFILVPLQLEQDTSIVYDSPYIKSMQSLVDFVVKHFPDQHIVVKHHPKDSIDIKTSGNVTQISNELPMHLLSFAAKAIVGINSTSLIEALVHYKPVAMLGVNVVSGCENICIKHKEAFENPRQVLDFKPCKSSIDATLKELLQRQFELSDPPERVTRDLLV